MNSIMHRAVLSLVAVAACQTAYAGDDPKVTAEVMALARSQWAAEVQGKSVAEQSVSMADDYTEFNPLYPVRIDGKAANMALYEADSSSGSRSLVGEMMNPKVQVYGDVAILTYNYVGVNRDKDGKTSSSAAKSTRVYAKQGGAWKLVHANFAPVVAQD